MTSDRRKEIIKLLLDSYMNDSEAAIRAKLREVLEKELKSTSDDKLVVLLENQARRDIK